EALGDDAEAPQYVETVGRVGYRFITPVTTLPVRSSEFEVRSPQSRAPNIPHPTPKMLGQQLTRLGEVEQRVLEGASVAGMEFSSAAVAAGLGLALEVVEEVCEALSRAGHILRAAGVSEWPDGTLSGRYGFRHALYQNVLYQRIAEVRRVRM